MREHENGYIWIEIKLKNERDYDLFNLYLSFVQ